jgi:SPX domain protein involved in polyphosphate accumulation
MGAMEVYRYERKFLVAERAAEAVRRFVATHLVPDEHMAALGPDGPDGYRVCSLYLDSPRLGLYRQSRDGIKNRYKLRIRYYDEAATAPAYLEIKKRTTETVHKLRAVVPKPAAERLLAGSHLSHADLLASGDAPHRALEEFCRCCERLSAVGVAFVSYRREAYVSQSAESVRVTLDRQVVGHAYNAGCGLAAPDECSAPVARGVVLELKYNGRAPRWMHDLVTSFSLQRRSFPKYVHCVDALNIAPENAVALVGSTRR